MRFTQAPALVRICGDLYSWGGRHRQRVENREEHQVLLDEYRRYQLLHYRTDHLVTSSDGVTQYRVIRMGITNKYICECLGFQYRRACRHIVEVHEKVVG